MHALTRRTLMCAALLLTLAGCGDRSGNIDGESGALVDDQLTPVRGFDEHSEDMSGIAERLEAGDELALLIYGFHAQYPLTWSRDLLVPALKLAGSVQLPLLDAAQITRGNL